jgi:hypothetical protein
VLSCEPKRGIATTHRLWKGDNMKEQVFDAIITVVDKTPEHSRDVENIRVSVKFYFNGFEMWHEYTGEYAVDILRASKS